VYHLYTPAKNGNNSRPVRTHPTLKNTAPLGLKLGFPRSLSQLATGLNGLGNKAIEMKVNAQKKTTTKMPARVSMGHFRYFDNS